MSTTTHDALTRQIEAGTDLFGYFQDHRDALEARQSAAEAQFDAWRRDRDTLGELGARGSRRACVFQGFVDGTDTVHSQPKGHFTMDGAVVDVGTINNVYLHLKTHMNTATDSKMFFYHISGYAYGEANHIDGKVAGYCYGVHKQLQALSVDGSHGLTAYEGSDGQIYLRMLFASTYYLTLSIDAMRIV